MNLFGWVLLLAVAAVAVADARLATRHRRAAPALGPAVAALLLAAFAWLAHAEAGWPGRLLLLGLLVTLASGPLLRRSGAAGGLTVAALAVTLTARLLFVAAVVTLPDRPHPGVLPGSVVAALVVVGGLGLAGLGFGSLRRLTGEPAARGVVTAYGVVVLGGVVLAAWQAVPMASAGLFALVGADLALGWSWLSRTPVPRAVPVAGLLVRHLGTALVVVGVVRPDLLS